MPPTTVTTKASASTVAPISGLAPCNGAASTPASPAIPVPSPNTSIHTRPISRPSTRAITGSRAPARITRPMRVRSISSHSASMTAAATPMTNRRYSGK